jgi:hypothetical protein
MADMPVISNHVLHGMPPFVRHEIGQKALLHANRAAGFDLELVEDRNCFIPHAAVVGFVNAAARGAGEANLGILMVPEMNAANYGSYGRYLLGAGTLGLAIERAITALPYHSTNDRMSVTIVGDEARYSYAFALAGCDGYRIIAPAAAGVLLSVCKSYLPTDWRPGARRARHRQAAPARGLRGRLRVPGSLQRSGGDHRHRTPLSYGGFEARFAADRYH